jgi:peptidoglycan hydrolase-like protein with peptidoglycan-binding domain
MVRAARPNIDQDYGALRGIAAAVLNWAKRRPTDTAATLLAAATILTIAINALFLQSGPHPAPIFANRLPAPPPAAASPATTVVPRARPNEVAVDLRPRSDAVIAEIQRELARRGFYDGAPDGVYGPRTDSAIRDFEQAAGLRPSAEPNDVLLQTIARSQVKAKPAASTPSRPDPIAELLAPNRRVIAVQRALTDFGYGQIKPSGFINPETKAAIEHFERDRKLPVSGQISDRLVRELAAVTGRPLE